MSEQIKTMRLLRRQGWSYRDIAQRLDLSPSTAHKYASGVIPETHLENIPVTPRLNLSQRQKVALATIASEEHTDLGGAIEVLVRLYHLAKKEGHGISEIEQYLQMREVMTGEGISIKDTKEYLQLKAELAKNAISMRNIEELPRLIQDLGKLSIDIERAKKLASFDSMITHLGLTPEAAIERLRFAEKVNNLGFTLQDAFLIAKEMERLEGLGITRPKAIKKMSRLLTEHDSLETAVSNEKETLTIIQTQSSSLAQERDLLVIERDKLKRQHEELEHQIAEEEKRREAARNECEIVTAQAQANRTAIMTAHAWLNALTDPHMLNLEQIEILRKELEKTEAIRKGQAPYLSPFKENIDDCIQNHMIEIFKQLVKNQIVDRSEYERKVCELQKTQDEKSRLASQIEKTESENELLGNTQRETALRLRSREEELRNAQSDNTVLEEKLKDKSEKMRLLTEENRKLEAWPKLNQRPEDLTEEQITHLISILNEALKEKKARNEIGEMLLSGVKTVLALRQYLEDSSPH